MFIVLIAVASLHLVRFEVRLTMIFFFLLIFKVLMLSLHFLLFTSCFLLGSGG